HLPPELCTTAPCAAAPHCRALLESQPGRRRSLNPPVPVLPLLPRRRQNSLFHSRLSRCGFLLPEHPPSRLCVLFLPRARISSRLRQPGSRSRQASVVLLRVG